MEISVVRLRGQYYWYHKFIWSSSFYLDALDLYVSSIFKFRCKIFYWFRISYFLIRGKRQNNYLINEYLFSNAYHFHVLKEISFIFYICIVLKFNKFCTLHILRVRSVSIMTLTTVEFYSPNVQMCYGVVLRLSVSIFSPHTYLS